VCCKPTVPSSMTRSQIVAREILHFALLSGAVVLVKWLAKSWIGQRTTLVFFDMIVDAMGVDWEEGTRNQRILCR